MSRPRAVIVVTGSELVRGERTDLNGPFLAREALRLGLEPARIAIVGDAPEELEAALREGLSAEACFVSGGLGPTHDDRTVEMVARAAGVGLRVDESLEREIEAVSRAAAERLKRPYADFAPGVTKQATMPEGARSLGLAGTAPGLLLTTGGRLCRRRPAGPAVGAAAALAERARDGPVPRAARACAAAGPPRPPLLRRQRVGGGAGARRRGRRRGRGGGDDLRARLRDPRRPRRRARRGARAPTSSIARLLPPIERWLFSRDERPIEAHVLDALRGPRADAGDGGVVHGRHGRGAADGRPGLERRSFVGGVVAYANEVKEGELGVPAALLEEHGAVSPEVAAAMARGARERLGADVAVAVTGIAGPDGGTPEKPVGLVYLHVEGPDGGRGREFSFPGDRASIRAALDGRSRSTSSRRLLTAES